MRSRAEDFVVDGKGVRLFVYDAESQYAAHAAAAVALAEAQQDVRCLLDRQAAWRFNTAEAAVLAHKVLPLQPTRQDDNRMWGQKSGRRPLGARQSHFT